MDATLLRTILEKAAGFRRDGSAFHVEDGFEVSVNLTVEGLSASVEKVRSITVEHGFVTLVTSDRGTTTYADAGSVATVSVRDAGTVERKRPGFA